MSDFTPSPPDSAKGDDLHDRSGPMAFITCLIALLVPLWIHRVAVDGWVEACFNRAFGIDTSAVSEEIVEKRRVAWWGRTGRPLLAAFSKTMAAIHAVRAITIPHGWGIVGSMPAGFIFVYFIALAAVVPKMTSVKWAVIIHRTTAIALPVILQTTLYWFDAAVMRQAFRHLFFKKMLAVLLTNTLFSTSTTPSFSTFVARHTTKHSQRVAFCVVLSPGH